MKFADFHLHTNISSDSTASPESIVEKAVSLGLDRICITDHNDFDYPLEDGRVVFNLDLKKYFDTMQQLKEAYSHRIKIYTGVEQGLTTVRPERIEEYDRDFADVCDFIIGSSHMVYGTVPYYREFWDGRTVAAGVEKYLQSILDNLTVCTNFDVYGHIDYIVRYIPKNMQEYDYKIHLDMYEAIFKKLILMGKGIEINTSGFRYGLGQPHPRLELIKFYRQLGGEIITTGSDAHAPQHVAIAFDKVKDLLTEAGFKYYTIFDKRKAEFIKVE